MPTPKYPNEIKINPNQGVKGAIERFVEAYGFMTFQALADHLNVSKSTLANQYLRNTFPTNWIIQCAPETGGSLRWLVTSEGPMHIDTKTEIIAITKEKTCDGNILNNRSLHFYSSLPPDRADEISKIESDDIIHNPRRNIVDINDASWAVSINRIYLIRELLRPSNNNIMLNTTKAECNIKDVEIFVKVKITCK